MARRTLPNKNDAQEFLILKRMSKGEKLFLELDAGASIGYSREYAKRIPSQLFTYLRRGEWIKLDSELEEWQLTYEVKSALEAYELPKRASSKNTRRKKRL